MKEVTGWQIKKCVRDWKSRIDEGIMITILAVRSLVLKLDIGVCS